MPLTWIQFLSASDLILGVRASASDFPGSSSSSSSSSSHVHRSRQVAAMLWNLRRIGTRWAAKNTPASHHRNPSRAGFICLRTAATALAYLTLDAMLLAPPPDMALVSIQKQTLWELRALTHEDYVFRTIATASFWVSVALLLLIIHNCVALPSAICGLCSASDCPPLFGSFADVASIRQFWGSVFFADTSRTIHFQYSSLISRHTLAVQHGINAFG